MLLRFAVSACVPSEKLVDIEAQDWQRLAVLAFVLIPAAIWLGFSRLCKTNFAGSFAKKAMRFCAKVPTENLAKSLDSMSAAQVFR